MPDVAVGHAAHVAVVVGGDEVVVAVLARLLRLDDVADELGKRDVMAAGSALRGSPGPEAADDELAGDPPEHIVGREKLVHVGGQQSGVGLPDEGEVDLVVGLAAVLGARDAPGGHVAADGGEEGGPGGAGGLGDGAVTHADVHHRLVQRHRHVGHGLVGSEEGGVCVQATRPLQRLPAPLEPSSDLFVVHGGRCRLLRRADVRQTVVCWCLWWVVGGGGGGGQT